MEDLIFATRYSLMPNMLGFCGPADLPQLIKHYRKGDVEDARLKEAIKRFESYYPYLEFISSKRSRSPFDSEVVEAYWVGNRLLEGFNAEELAGLISSRFMGEGKLGSEMAEQLAASVPEGCVPHHSFHVLYLHSITGRLPPTLENLDSCMVSWGRVKAVDGEIATVIYKPLKSENGYLLGDEKEKQVALNVAGFSTAGEPRVGDWVSMHWNMAIQVLTEDERSRLEKYTLRNITAINSASLGKA